MLRTCQAVLIKIHVFCQDIKGYNLQFLEVMYLYYCEAGMRIERCREDCCDLCNLQAAGEQLSPKFWRLMINLTQVYNFPICLYSGNIFSKGLTMAVFTLLGNWPDNVEVLMIWVSVCRMSSRHSSRREVGMISICDLWWILCFAWKDNILHFMECVIVIGMLVWVRHVIRMHDN